MLKVQAVEQKKPHKRNATMTLTKVIKAAVS